VMEKRYTCIVDNQGRITLPAEWRKEHGVEAGAKVYLTPGEFGLEVATLTQSVRHAQAIVAKYTKGKGSLVDALLAERRREVRLEEAKYRRMSGKPLRQFSSDRIGSR
jgi:bifunctional DNA-binding transcriptional regulator/antitoxin component of YhaV-PrlF toxin-antitoxin module